MRRGLGGVLMVVSSSAVIGFAALAQDDKKQGDFPVPRPTAEHKRLRDDVGTWDAKVKFFMGGPEAPPQVSEALEVNRLMPGGLWMITDFGTEIAGQPFAGHGVFGYDTAKKKYVGSWVDSMGTALTIMEGTYDEATKKTTMTGESTDPNGKPIKMKEIITYKDDGTHTMEMHMQAEETGGQMVKFMEVDYRKHEGELPKGGAFKKFFQKKGAAKKGDANP